MGKSYMIIITRQTNLGVGRLDILHLLLIITYIQTNMIILAPPPRTQLTKTKAKYISKSYNVCPSSVRASSILQVYWHCNSVQM